MMYSFGRITPHRCPKGLHITWVASTNNMFQSMYHRFENGYRRASGVYRGRGPRDHRFEDAEDLKEAASEDGVGPVDDP